MTTALAYEPVRLAELESIIERGLATFVQVGEALLEIRDSRLYRETHGTFEDYCRERWNITPQHGGRLIAAAEVVATLEPIGSSPTSEAVSRELTVLRDEPEQLREAWQETVERHGDTPTAAQVREVVVGRTQGQLANQSGGTDEWSTPQPLFAALHREFDFNLDVCALPSSAKCSRYFTPENDGLAQEWQGSCWMNPPYGRDIDKWIAKAADSAAEGATVVCLVPARVDTGWWWDYCRYAEIRFLRGRLRFGEADTGAPFPSAVVVFRPKQTASVEWWQWQ